VLSGFSDFITLDSGKCILSDRLRICADELFHDLGSGIASHLKPFWEKGLADGHPDHGVVAGAHIIQSISHKNNQTQNCFAREAARAMAVHNLIGKVSSTATQFLSWEEEPIACMLLLCDQIQTWDRERGDKTLSQKDEPDRAELLDLTVNVTVGRPQIRMSIEYVAPRYLDHAPEVFNRVKDSLENVIEEKPKAALSHIKRPWPFSLLVECWLSGRQLNRKMDFQDLG